MNILKAYTRSKSRGKIILKIKDWQNKNLGYKF